MSRSMVQIRRIGPNVTDWSLTMDDGSPMPPISSLSIDLTAGKVAELSLEVVDVDFDGALDPAWKVSFETLAAMAADAGLELQPQGAFEEVKAGFEQITNNLAESRAATATTERELTRLRRKVEEHREAQALLKTDRDAARTKASGITILLTEAEARYEALLERFVATVGQREDALNALMRERRSIELAAQTKAIHAQHAGPADPIDDDSYDELQALRLELSASRYIIADAQDSRLRCSAYEQENHALKRRLALGGIGPAQVPAHETIRYTPILAVPTAHMRDVTQKHLGDAMKVVCYDQALTGYRTDLIVVAAPTPEQAASARFWEQFEGITLAHLRGRLALGGKLVRL